MVHYGKHIIDHQTGLCEICNRGAIYDLRHGKRAGKQFLYSNQDGKFTYRPNNNENSYPEQSQQQTPRYVRKPLYPEPAPPIRQRQVVHEEPVVQRKIPRRTQSPVDEHHSRLTTFYYVDNAGQMYARNEGPINEPRQGYQAQQHHHHQPPPPQQQQQHPRAHPTRVIPQRARTPPPPASKTWRSPPQRQHKSDTEIFPQQSQRAPLPESYYDYSSRKVEMFYIDRPRDYDRFTTIGALAPQPVENYPTPPRNNNRKQRQLEPVEQKHHHEPEQTFVRKVYKKLPPKQVEPHEDEYIPNGYHPQAARKAEKYYPSPRTYDSTPQLSNRQFQTPLNNKYPSTYHIQSEYA